MSPVANVAAGFAGAAPDSITAAPRSDGAVSFCYVAAPRSDAAVPHDIVMARSGLDIGTNLALHQMGQSGRAMTIGAARTTPFREAWPMAVRQARAVTVSEARTTTRTRRIRMGARRVGMRRTINPSVIS